VPLLSILGYTFLSSFLSLIGGVALLAHPSWTRKIYLILVAFAAGALLGAAFFDLLPEVNQKAGGDGIFTFTAIGMVLFFFIEKFLLWYHAHTGHEEHAEHPTIVPLVILGDAVHNFIDGVAIAIAFLTSPSIGVVTAAAIFLHELPQEIGDFSVLLYAKVRPAKVLLYNVISSLTAFAGAFIAYYAGLRIEGLAVPLIAVTAGGFLYIAAAELIPEIVHKEKPGLPAILKGFVLLLGMGAIYLVTRLVSD
jgi:zinc and cadmium transporter